MPKFKPSLPPIYLSFRVSKLVCLSDTDEFDSDEPYVLVTAADLTTPTPNLRVTLVNPADDVDAGETVTPITLPPGTPQSVIDAARFFKVVSQPFWGLDNGQPA